MVATAHAVVVSGVVMRGKILEEQSIARLVLEKPHPGDDGRPHLEFPSGTHVR